MADARPCWWKAYCGIIFVSASSSVFQFCSWRGGGRGPAVACLPGKQLTLLLPPPHQTALLNGTCLPILVTFVSLAPHPCLIPLHKWGVHSQPTIQVHIPHPLTVQPPYILALPGPGPCLSVLVQEPTAYSASVCAAQFFGGLTFLLSSSNSGSHPHANRFHSGATPLSATPTFQSRKSYLLHFSQTEVTLSVPNMSSLFVSLCPGLPAGSALLPTLTGAYGFVPLWCCPTITNTSPPAGTTTEPNLPVVYYM